MNYFLPPPQPHVLHMADLPSRRGPCTAPDALVEWMPRLEEGFGPC